MSRISNAVLLAASLLFAAAAGAQESAPDEEPLIQPEVERREISVPQINVDDLEVGIFFGVLNVEQFDSNVIAGLRLGYHVTADVFVEFSLAGSTVSDERYRRFGLAIFPDEEEQLQRYDLSVAYSFLPGEVFLGEDSSMRSAFFVIGGVGAVDFADEENFSFNLGLGVRLLPGEDFVLRIEMRDYVFESDLLGENELTHNLELVSQLSFLF